MYINQDPPLVLHMLTSWQLAAQLVTSPHASAEVGLGSDLNGQSPGQKTNALPLCQRPGLLYYDIFIWVYLSAWTYNTKWRVGGKGDKWPKYFSRLTAEKDVFKLDLKEWCESYFMELKMSHFLHKYTQIFRVPWYDKPKLKPSTQKPTTIGLVIYSNFVTNSSAIFFFHSFGTVGCKVHKLSILVTMDYPWDQCTNRRLPQPWPPIISILHAVAYLKCLLTELAFLNQT